MISLHFGDKVFSVENHLFVDKVTLVMCIPLLQLLYFLFTNGNLLQIFLLDTLYLFLLGTSKTRKLARNKCLDGVRTDIRS